ncbi:MAG: hypothetical protein ACK5K7_07410, partial [Bacilli bacterium]
NVVNEELLNKAKYEEPKSAEVLALETLQLENKIGKHFSNNLKDDYENSGIDNIGVPGTSQTNSEDKQGNNVLVDNVIELINKNERRMN